MSSSLRGKKLQSLFKKLVSEFFRRFDFKNCLISVTHVEFSNDLKSARIFVSIYPEKQAEKILKLLEKNKSALRKHIGSKTKIKFLPALKLEIDKSENKLRKIEEVLKGLVAKR